VNKVVDMFQTIGRMAGGVLSPVNR
jgi:hypothetical protein